MVKVSKIKAWPYRAALNLAFFSEKEGFPIHNIKRNESDGDATVRRIQCKSSLISLDLEYLSLCGIFSIQNLLGFP